jgi:hypothetical protein
MRGGSCGLTHVHTLGTDRERLPEAFLRDASLLLTYHIQRTAAAADALRRLAPLVVPFFTLKLSRCGHAPLWARWSVGVLTTGGAGGHCGAHRTEMVLAFEAFLSRFAPVDADVLYAHACALKGRQRCQRGWFIVDRDRLAAALVFFHDPALGLHLTSCAALLGLATPTGVRRLPRPARAPNVFFVCG